MKNKKKLALGVDCGGTNLKLALVDESGAILKSQLTPVRFDLPREKVVDNFARAFKAFLKAAGSPKVEGIGMGIAGDVDQERGIVRFSPNLNWKDVPLADMLRKRIDWPLLIENDANCAAWGAYCLDAGRGCENLICLTLGTGVGGGIIIRRKLYRGASGSAGEAGHMTVDYRGRACKCGNFGCIESMLGAWGLVQSAEEGLKRGSAPILAKLLRKSKGAGLSPKLISQAAREGDAFSAQLWRDAGQILGCALSNFINLFNPERIVLAGGVCKVGDLLLEPALHEMGRRAFQTPARRVQVTISRFDERLGVVGAGLLIWE